MEIHDLVKLMGSRRSCRSYLRNMQVEKSKIDECIEALRLAPSACNRQPWRLVVVSDRSSLDKICSECLLPGLPMPWLKDAPTIVALCLDLDFVTHKIAPIISGLQYQMIDAGIAGEHFVLAAEAQGLGTCWIGWFNEKKVRKLLDIPRRVRVVSLISLGYPSPGSNANASSRLSPKEIAFQHKWKDL